MIPNIITRSIQFMELNGSVPLEGWGLFAINETDLEVQKLDDSDKLKSDDEALQLAKKRGLKFEDFKNQYKLTGFGSILL